MPPRKDNLEKRIKRFQYIDEEKIPKMLQTVEGFVKSRNTFTESEFSKFQPLYKRNVRLEPAQHQTLEKELYSRVSPFEPIRIVSDTGDAQGNHKVLMTLPPILNQHNTVNDAAGTSKTTVDAFVNRTEDHNPLSTSAERATDNLMQLVSKTVADEEAKKRNAMLVAQAEHDIAEAKKNNDGDVDFYDDEESIDSIDDFEDDRNDSDFEDDEDELDFEDDDTSLEDLVDDDE